MKRMFIYISTHWGKEWLFFCLLFFPFIGMIVSAYGLFRLAFGIAKDHDSHFLLLVKWGITGFFLMAIVMMLLLGISLISNTKPPFNEKIRKITISTLFPLTVLIGKILHIPREEIQESFLKVNNKLIRKNTHDISPQKILLLLPRCLQKSTCTIGLAPEGRNCQRCGGCEIGNLWEMADRCKVHLVVAKGGEVARKFIRDHKPEAVVAVACTKEIILGIQDTYPLSVLSIVNEWPHGPCIDTTTNLAKVEEAIKIFLGNGQSNHRTDRKRES
ncbi:MAG: DUF116 domain-containing protein [Candidatus Binatia bacterium]